MNNKFDLNHIVYVYKNERKTYAESSYVLSGKPGVAKPLTAEAMKKIFSLTHESEREAFSDGIMDPGILSFSDRIADQHLLWYRKSRIRKIITVNKAYTIWMPAMLFYWDSSNLSLFALKTDSRPNMRTMLYYAPIKNLIQNGYNFCWGNVNPVIKEHKINRILNEWEGYIWESNFNNDGPNMVKSGDIYSLYSSLEKSGKKFPKSELVDTKMNVKSIL